MADESTETVNIDISNYKNFDRQYIEENSQEVFINYLFDAIAYICDKTKNKKVEINDQIKNDDKILLRESLYSLLKSNENESLFKKIKERFSRNNVIDKYNLVMDSILVKNSTFNKDSEHVINPLISSISQLSEDNSEITYFVILECYSLIVCRLAELNSVQDIVDYKNEIDEILKFIKDNDYTVDDITNLQQKIEQIKTSCLIKIKNHTTDLSYAIKYYLFKNPIYRSLQKNKNNEEQNLNILLIGFGNTGQLFMDNCIELAQNLDVNLSVTIASKNIKSEFKIYKSFRPELSNFFKINDKNPNWQKAISETDYKLDYGEINPKEYDIKFGSLNKCLKKIIGDNSPNYVFISLGLDNSNVKVAEELCKIVSNVNSNKSKTLVNYELSSQNTKYKNKEKDWGELRAFTSFASYEDILGSGTENNGAVILNHINRMAFNCHLVWAGWPMVNIKEQYKSFNESSNHFSSISNIVSIKYKLFSVGTISGLNNDDDFTDFSNITKLINNYTKVTSDKKSDLMYREHKRWVVEKICQGWRVLNDYQRCVTELKNNQDKEYKLHTCLVHAWIYNNKTYKLPENIIEWNNVEKDKLDELDKVSVLLHKEYVNQCNNSDYKSNVFSVKLSLFNEINYACVNDKVVDLSKLKDSLDQWSNLIDEIIEFTNLQLSEDQNKYITLCSNPSGIIDLYSILSSNLIKQLNANGLSYLISQVESFTNDYFYVYLESAKCVDYKSIDKLLIDRLPFVLVYDNNIEYHRQFKFVNIGKDTYCPNSMYENIEPVVRYNPQKIIYHYDTSYIKNSTDKKSFEIILLRLKKFLLEKTNTDVGSIDCPIVKDRVYSPAFDAENYDDSFKLDGVWDTTLTITVRDMLTLKGSKELNRRSDIYLYNYRDIYKLYIEYLELWKGSQDNCIASESNGIFTKIQLYEIVSIINFNSDIDNYDFDLPVSVHESINYLMPYFVHYGYLSKFHISFIDSQTIRLTIEACKIPKENMSELFHKIEYLNDPDSIIFIPKDWNTIRNNTKIIDELFSRIKKEVSSTLCSISGTRNKSKFIESLMKKSYSVCSIYYDTSRINKEDYDDIFAHKYKVRRYKLLEELINTQILVKTKSIRGDDVYLFPSRTKQYLLEKRGSLFEMFVFHTLKFCGKLDDVVASQEIINKGEKQTFSNDCEVDCVVTKNQYSAFIECKSFNFIDENKIDQLCHEGPRDEGIIWKIGRLSHEYGFNALPILVIETKDKRIWDLNEKIVCFESKTPKHPKLKKVLILIVKIQDYSNNGELDNQIKHSSEKLVKSIVESFKDNTRAKYISIDFSNLSNTFDIKKDEAVKLSVLEKWLQDNLTSASKNDSKNVSENEKDSSVFFDVKIKKDATNRDDNKALNNSYNLISDKNREDCFKAKIKHDFKIEVPGSDSYKRQLNAHKLSQMYLKDINRKTVNINDENEWERFVKWCNDKGYLLKKYTWPSQIRKNFVNHSIFPLINTEENKKISRDALNTKMHDYKKKINCNYSKYK